MAKVHTQGIAAAEPHQPLITRAAPAPAPRVPACPRFLYFWRPDRYQAAHGAIVPGVVKMVVEPGVNGVDAKGNPDGAIATRVRRGWILIPEDVDGDGTSYLARRTNHEGKVFWLDQFAPVHNGSSHVGDGSEKFAGWLVSLMDRGVIAKPAPYIVEALQEELGEAAQRLEDRALRSEAVELRKVNASIQACVDFLNPPAPKRKASK